MDTNDEHFFFYPMLSSSLYVDYSHFCLNAKINVLQLWYSNNKAMIRQLAWQHLCHKWSVLCFVPHTSIDFKASLIILGWIVSIMFMLWCVFFFFFGWMPEWMNYSVSVSVLLCEIITSSRVKKPMVTDLTITHIILSFQ